MYHFKYDLFLHGFKIYLFILKLWSLSKSQVPGDIQCLAGVICFWKLAGMITLTYSTKPMSVIPHHQTTWWLMVSHTTKPLPQCQICSTATTRRMLLQGCKLHEPPTTLWISALAGYHSKSLSHFWIGITQILGYFTPAIQFVSARTTEEVSSVTCAIDKIRKCSDIYLYERPRSHMILFF